MIFFYLISPKISLSSVQLQRYYGNVLLEHIKENVIFTILTAESFGFIMI